MRKPYCTPKYVIYPCQETDVLTLSTDPTVADTTWKTFDNNTSF